jgi:hypothetical protein
VQSLSRARAVSAIDEVGPMYFIHVVGGTRPFFGSRSDPRASTLDGDERLFYGWCSYLNGNSPEHCGNAEFRHLGVHDLYVPGLLLWIMVKVPVQALEGFSRPVRVSSQRVHKTPGHSELHPKG